MKNYIKSYTNNKKAKAFIIVSCVLLVLIVVVSFFLGASNLSFKEVVDGFLNPDSINGRIIYKVRLPRIMATLFSGMSLAISGTIIQKILYNPLASPNIIGVNSGALFGVVLFSALIPSLSGIYAIIPAFIGSLLSCAIIYLISKKSSFSKTSLILSGIAINSIFQSMVDFIIELYPDSLPYGQMFRVGGATGVTLETIIPFAVLITIGLIISIILSPKLDLYALGDEVSLSLGMNVKVIRVIFLLLACLLAASAVSFMGLLGFVGLICPHIVRYFIKGSTRQQMYGGLIFGGFFLTFCDMIARTCFSPNEVPVGIILSFIGGPFFIGLLIWRKKNA